ncbi:MAG: NADH-quinone oxidoreductase subunit J [Alphaproteobacteria bacterium]|nr:NADH-quinone oxidoreductase subunit J [Alphaproteobacteria bacterium]
MITAIAFYLFSSLTILSGLMVITSRNPVYSVLFLIVAFFNSAALFILLGAEFLAMTLVIVYVGAVAVLFLFVVMMLDINFAELKQGISKYTLIGLVIGTILFLEIIFIVGTGINSLQDKKPLNLAHPIEDKIQNTKALGDIIYTDYLIVFQTAGVILLVAMIGAITLTLRHRLDVKHQSIARQTSRKVKETINIIDVGIGKGVE